MLFRSYERVSRIAPPVFGIPAPLAAWAQTADVARMPDGLARRISSFLVQANGLTPATRDRLSRSLASEASVFVSPVPQANAEMFLAATTAIRRDRERAALDLEKRGIDALEPLLRGMPHQFPRR